MCANIYKTLLKYLIFFFVVVVNVSQNEKKNVNYTTHN